MIILAHHLKAFNNTTPAISAPSQANVTVARFEKVLNTEYNWLSEIVFPQLASDAYSFLVVCFLVFVMFFTSKYRYLPETRSDNKCFFFFFLDRQTDKLFHSLFFQYCYFVCCVAPFSVIYILHAWLYFVSYVNSLLLCQWCPHVCVRYLLTDNTMLHHENCGFALSSLHCQ